MKFSKYKIADEIKENLDRLGFIKTTDIQYKAIPSIMKGEDVLAVAQTGTGKTAAFAIPIINKIHNYKTSKRSYGVKALILVPTRELAIQTATVFNKLAKNTRTQVIALYGGVDQDHQISTLVSGVDVVISTPGRMFDLIHQKYLDIRNIEILVLDEADHMLDLGFIEDIISIKKIITKKHQTLFFSATINAKIKKLAYSQIKSDAIRIQISPKDPVSKNVTHFVAFIEMDDKRFFLKRFIENNPDSKIIVFVRTKVRAERVLKALKRFNIESMTLHGDKEQEERNSVMKKIKSGEINILIATDISARGIDIPDVDYVINYDIPTEKENYVHRVGRTGRGVKKGTAISYCSEEEKSMLNNIEGFLNNKIDTIEIAKKEYSEVVKSLKNAETIKILSNVMDEEKFQSSDDWKSLITKEEEKNKTKRSKKKKKKKKKK
jgi:ATP-dependent RNA helicase RhlE